MEPLAALVVGAVAASVAYLVASARARTRAAAWRSAATAVGLTDVREHERLGIPSSLAGRSGQLELTLDRYQRGKYESGTRITIRGMGHDAAGLSLRREGLATSFEKLVGEREIELGDPAFDGEVYVQGSTPLARAVLDAATRRLLVELLGGHIPAGGGGSVAARVTLAGGMLRAELQQRAFVPPSERLPEVLATLLDAARRLSAPPDPARRIAENLRSEPVAGVRLQSLQMLLREFGDHPAAREALLAARSDASPEVRLRAGVALGEEGRDVLLELAAAEDAGDACAAGAVDALGARLTRERAEAILERALRARRVVTARACLRALGGGGDAGALAALVKVLAAEANEVGAEAAQALATLGQPAAQPALLAALASVSAAVRTAAAGALGTLGDAGAVAPLRAAASAPAADGALKRAVRQAVAEIQSRLSGAAPGQLSLVPEAGEAGRLSLAEVDGGGRLSLIGPAADEAEGADAPRRPGEPER